MAINFPDSPSNGDTHTESGRTFTYNTSKTKWVYSNSPNASVTSSDTAPTSPNVGDMWLDSATGELLIWYADGSSNQWIGVSGTAGPTGSPVTSYANLAALPSSGNAHGDFAYAQDTKVPYMYLDTSWKRMSVGPQIGPRLTTTPAATHTLNSDGTTSTLTMVAVDEAGFPIIYDWDAVQGSTLYNAASLPTALTAVSESGGVFTLTPSTTSGHATTTLKFRTKASDGVLFTPAISTLELAFRAAHSCQYIIIAGGASGGIGMLNAYQSGGGGAGGLLYGTATLAVGVTWTVTIGAGGALVGGTSNAGGNNGSNSTIIGTGLSGATAIGGGRGGGGNDVDRANVGGSGGGGGGNHATGRLGAAATSGQGYAGGDGSDGSPYSGGGGGGSSEVGNDGDTGDSAASKGGNGLNTYSSWATATSTGVGGRYAGGGSGAPYSATAIASIGSGAGASFAAATANTGSGGGAGNNQGNVNRPSGAGGSGLVIVRYAASSVEAPLGGTVVTASGYTYHTFTSSSTLAN